MAKLDLTMLRSFVMVWGGGVHRPMPVCQEPLCIQVWWDLGEPEADMTGSGGSGFKCPSYLEAA